MNLAAPRRPAWLTGVPAETHEVDCLGVTHTVTWDGGDLVLHDHDTEAERALVALGGDAAGCVELLQAWDVARTDIDILAMFGNVYGFDPRIRRATVAVASGVRSRAIFGPRDISPEQRARIVVARMPKRLRRLLALTVVAHHAPSWANPRRRAAIEPFVNAYVSQQAAPCIEDSVRSWRRSFGWHSSIECWVTEPGGIPSISGYANKARAVVAASVPLSWLRDVWAPRITIVDGCFVLDVLERDGSTLTVSAVRWIRQPSGISVPLVGRAQTTRREQGGWFLHWLEP